MSDDGLTLPRKLDSGRHYEVQATFDSRVVGEPYTVEVRENDRRLSVVKVSDPFHNTTVHPRGLRAALAVLLRRYSITVIVDAPSQLIEDVMELDENYRGIAGSKRRELADAWLERGLRDFAARAGEATDD